MLPAPNDSENPCCRNVLRDAFGSPAYTVHPLNRLLYDKIVGSCGRAIGWQVSDLNESLARHCLLIGLI